MKADRLLSIVMLLQAHGSLSGRILADRLGVSPRTVHRDMDALSAAGVPIYATRGAHGGWRLDEGWRTKVPGLASDELQALLLAHPRAIGESHLAASAERALTKLLAALPETLRAEAATIRQRMFVDPTGWRGVVEDLSALPVVHDAVWRMRQLRMLYRPADGEAGERVVHPLGLVAKGTTWYLVADTPRGLRTYRVSRIRAPELLESPAVRPAGFDLAAFWKASTERLHDRTRVEVEVQLEPGVMPWICEWTGARPASPGDHRRWIIPFESEAHAVFVLLGLGSRVQVLRPADLRARVTAEHAAALDRLAGVRAAIGTPTG